MNRSCSYLWVVVYVIAKGKDLKQYEYGNKVSIVSTKDTNIMTGYANNDVDPLI